MNLQQLIDEPTHRCGNILDLVFCVDDLDCNAIRSGHQLSDHYPVTFSLSIDTPSRPPVLCFSRSQFDGNLFAFNLSNLYSYIFSSIVHCASFCHDWQLLFGQALDLSLPRKRRKCVDSPYYYSSHGYRTLSSTVIILQAISSTIILHLSAMEDIAWRIITVEDKVLYPCLRNGYRTLSSTVIILQAISSMADKWRIMVEDIAWRIITVEDKARFPLSHDACRKPKEHCRSSFAEGVEPSCCAQMQIFGK